MLINSKFYLAICCGMCSKPEIYEFSIFNLRKKKKNKVTCLCGRAEACIKTDDYKTFYITVSCFSCGKNHIFKYGLNEILTKDGYEERCSFTNEKILLIGSQKWVEKRIKEKNEEIETIMENLGFDNSFHNPEIMIEALNYIHDIAEEKKLYCDCGNHEIDMNLFSDRIELKCTKCNSISIIYAETQDDLAHLMNTKDIILHEKTFVCIDAFNYRKNIR